MNRILGTPTTSRVGVDADRRPIRRSLLGLASTLAILSIANVANATTPNGGFSNTGVLMAFGGANSVSPSQFPTSLQYETNSVAGSSLQVLTDLPGASAGYSESIVIEPTGGGLAELQTASPVLCITANGTSSNAVTLEPCSASNANQQWLVEGGQITLGNSNNCLGILNGNNDGLGDAVVEVAACDGSQAQEFWTAGYTIGIQSSTLTNGTEPECVDVMYNEEYVGAEVDDSVCNATDAQWWVLTKGGAIELANTVGTSNPLCIAAGGLSQTLMLENCAKVSLAEAWVLSNQSNNRVYVPRTCHGFVCIGAISRSRSNRTSLRRPARSAGR